MSAYVIMIRNSTFDDDALQAYRSLAREARGDQPPKIKVFYGLTEVLEGPPVEGIAILEFANLEKAKSWYESPAYREAKKQRLVSANYSVFLVEGTADA